MYASVADEIEFASWPQEQQDLARRVLQGQTVWAYVDEVEDGEPFRTKKNPQDHDYKAD